MHSETSKGPILTYLVKTFEFLKNKCFGCLVIFQHWTSSYSLNPVLPPLSIAGRQAGIRTKIKPSTTCISSSESYDSRKCIKEYMFDPNPSL